MANGHWYTDKQGNHYFVENGQSPKEGWEASKRRKMIDGGSFKVSEDGENYEDVDEKKYREFEADESDFDETIDDDFGFDENDGSDVEKFNSLYDAIEGADADKIENEVQYAVQEAFEKGEISKEQYDELFDKIDEKALVDDDNEGSFDDLYDRLSEDYDLRKIDDNELTNILSDEGYDRDQIYSFKEYLDSKFLNDDDVEKETQEALDKSDYVMNEKGQAVPRKYNEKYGNNSDDDNVEDDTFMHDQIEKEESGSGNVSDNDPDAIKESDRINSLRKELLEQRVNEIDKYLNGAEIKEEDFSRIQNEMEEKLGYGPSNDALFAYMRRKIDKNPYTSPDDKDFREGYSNKTKMSEEEFRKSFDRYSKGKAGYDYYSFGKNKGYVLSDEEGTTIGFYDLDNGTFYYEDVADNLKRKSDGWKVTKGGATGEGRGGHTDYEDGKGNWVTDWGNGKVYAYLDGKSLGKNFGSVEEAKKAIESRSKKPKHRWERPDDPEKPPHLVIEEGPDAGRYDDWDDYYNSTRKK